MISSDKMNDNRRRMEDEFSNYIHEGKREAIDGTHVDSKGTGITK